MTTAEYIQSLNSRFKLGLATEHTFRGDLQNLLESLVPDIKATNEPKRQACGAPDYILTNKKESLDLNKSITQYPVAGENIVEKIRFEENYEVIDGDCILIMEPVEPMGRVFINEYQFFQMVPTVVWNFNIGGYQPSQKWLKDRKGRVLDFEDIMHYQRIIKALVETDR